MSKFIHFILLSALSLTIYAQVAPPDQQRYNRYLDIAEHDSISRTLEVGGSFVPFEEASIDFHFQDDSKKNKMIRYSSGQVFLNYTGVWKGNHCILAAFNPNNNPQDTTEKYIYYLNRWGQDSAQISIIEYNTQAEQRRIEYFNYRANGKVGRVIFARGPNLRDTFAIETFYYKSGELDSAITRDGTGKLIIKGLFSRKASKEIKEIYFVGLIPGNVYDTLVSYEPTYLNSKVVSVKEYNHLFVPQKKFNAEWKYLKKAGSSLNLDEKAKSGFNFYPNPVADHLQIVNEAFDLRTTHVTISNMGGKILTLPIEEEKHRLIINTSDLASGIYTCSVTKADGILIKSFLFVK